ncbi:MAG TPA: RnfABCDGE type electron transport complex subunit D [Candidatus Omnitrophota bacterium]|nr:RnfABCDGE type electron transport complex subunit D [Candidatus Omnitrophota bacterium]HRY85940.1 RnfABCDGE type electron transport complex subunit D [Candidatus Omnitrophota bacterium]
MNWRSVKVQINLFLAALAAYLILRDPSVKLLAAFAWAVFFTVLTEGSVLFLKTKKFQITASAITSGWIIGFVLSAGSPWWMFFAAAALTIGSKHLLRFRGKNLLNPAACGLFLTVLLLKGYTEWKGAYVWYLLIPAGLYLVHKIRKMEIVIGYFVMSILLFVPLALIRGSSLADIPGYFNYFFIFIMLIEPKTTPPTFWPKVAFGAGTAVLVFLLTEWGFRYEPELFALLAMNALVPWINKIPDFQLKTVIKNS